MARRYWRSSFCSECRYLGNRSKLATLASLLNQVSWHWYELYAICIACSHAIWPSYSCMHQALIRTPHCYLVPSISMKDGKSVFSSGLFGRAVKFVDSNALLGHSVYQILCMYNILLLYMCCSLCKVMTEFLFLVLSCVPVKLFPKLFLI